MTPGLPSNPMTITPPARTPRTAEGMRRAYADQAVDARLRLQLEAELENLRAWDNYERKTDEAREGAKQVIAELLNPDQGSDPPAGFDKVLTGTIEPDKIQAGTIEDEDGELMRLTDEFMNELKPVGRQTSQ